MSLESALRALVSFFDERRTPYMVIGGIANLVWGQPRATLDIDVTVWTGKGREGSLVRRLCASFRALPPDPAAFVADTRVLPLEVEGVRVDVVFGQLPYEKNAIRRARLVEFAGAKVRVCAPEDLIAHKVMSDRLKDREDVKGVIAAQGATLNRATLDPLVRGLAHDLAKPELLDFYLSCWPPDAKRPRR